MNKAIIYLMSYIESGLILIAGSVIYSIVLLRSDMTMTLVYIVPFVIRNFVLALATLVKVDSEDLNSDKVWIFSFVISFFILLAAMYAVITGNELVIITRMAVIMPIIEAYRMVVVSHKYKTMMKG